MGSSVPLTDKIDAYDTSFSDSKDVKRTLCMIISQLLLSNRVFLKCVALQTLLRRTQKKFTHHLHALIREDKEEKKNEKPD